MNGRNGLRDGSMSPKISKASLGRKSIGKALQVTLFNLRSNLDQIPDGLLNGLPRAAFRPVYDTGRSSIPADRPKKS
jgi:hypothetical protein